MRELYLDELEVPNQWNQVRVKLIVTAISLNARYRVIVSSWNSRGSKLQNTVAKTTGVAKLGTVHTAVQVIDLRI
jgi:hypothetical protein